MGWRLFTAWATCPGHDSDLLEVLVWGKECMSAGTCSCNASMFIKPFQASEPLQAFFFFFEPFQASEPLQAFFFFFEPFQASEPFPGLRHFF